MVLLNLDGVVLTLLVHYLHATQFVVILFKHPMNVKIQTLLALAANQTALSKQHFMPYLARLHQVQMCVKVIAVEIHKMD